MINIKIATIKDYEIINNLHIKLHNFHYENKPNHFHKIDNFYTKEQYIDRLNNNFIFLIAFINKLPVGVICIHLYENDFYKVPFINSFYVEENYRNQKIGTLLMDEAIKLIKENCNSKDYCDYINLGVETFNENAIKFYQKYGFKIKHHDMELKFK